MIAEQGWVSEYRHYVYMFIIGCLVGAVLITNTAQNRYAQLFNSWWVLNYSHRAELLNVRTWLLQLGSPVNFGADDGGYITSSAMALTAFAWSNRSRIPQLRG